MIGTKMVNFFMVGLWIKVQYLKGGNEPDEDTPVTDTGTYGLGEEMLMLQLH